MGLCRLQAAALLLLLLLLTRRSMQERELRRLQWQLHRGQCHCCSVRVSHHVRVRGGGLCVVLVVRLSL